MRKSCLLVLGLALSMAACGEDDPKESNGGGGGAAGGGAGGAMGGGAGGAMGGGAGGGAGGAMGGGAGGSAGGAMGGGAGGGGGDQCVRPDDYYPGDQWDACISDDGRWHLAGESTPSSAARVASYEQIGDLLWRADGPPSSDAFIEAQLIYAADGGLDSRVVRRYDSHVPKPEGADCRAEDAGERWPEYCVGPARIRPLLLDAFDAGIAGQEPVLNARRIEAGLLWFLYVSTFKEANSCAGTAKDCDSSWAYYCGGRQLEEDALGFGGLVQDLDPDVHAAIFDGLLAVRCWRDLDSGETAMNEELMRRAHRQLDAGLDSGLAVILVDRLQTLMEAEGDARQPHWVFLEILGPVIDRAARNADAAAADELMAIWNGDGTNDDAARAIEILETLFACPY